MGSVSASAFFEGLRLVCWQLRAALSCPWKSFSFSEKRWENQGLRHPRGKGWSPGQCAGSGGWSKAGGLEKRPHSLGELNQAVEKN